MPISVLFQTVKKMSLVNKLYIIVLFIHAETKKSKYKCIDRVATDLRKDCTSDFV